MSSKRPGMSGKASSNKPKPEMTRLKTVWITQKTAPFKSAYQVGQQIGEPGQFGKAYRCKRKKDKKIFAVKCISKARFYRLDRSAQRRQALLVAMQGEIDIMRRLKHKYIVSMEECYEDKHTLYIVMEECKGGELFDRIREKQRYQEKDAAPIIRMVLEALFYMHEYHRVVHCDLKPDNILFVDKSEKSPIKMIDFGMSKVLPRLRSLRELCGTPYYTAPEIIKGDYAHGCDMWSVGVIMFVMLFGFPPFYVDPAKYYGQREAQAIYRLIQKGFDPKVKRGYGPWFPKKMPASEEARDLMARLIESDTSKRLTAKEALQHPWILHSGKSQKEIEKELKAAPMSPTGDDNKDDESGITKEIGYQFANFATSNQFKHAITALFRGKFEKLRPQHFENLKKLFAQLDTDGNGTIDYNEFKNGMLNSKDLNLTEADIQKMFQAMDVKKVGEIDFEALVNAAVHDYLIASDQRLYEAFRDLDDDEDGKIKTDQLKAKIRELDTYGKADELINIIDSVDLDKDGTIDYEEFLRALHPDFNETPKWFWGASNYKSGMDTIDEAKDDK
eukprot:CAMPEP_0197040688 /NCGR_PEP_ID=MMETSP1384-20130603/17333_1 /TAXON_ID=29189 /ORGANISM="Ammonia sp." /LENGTH=559 /DNA_ID=CAMNT_0042471489 /DNA_START=61 /DNA_END=1740 /DNA_ORIENTATION=+